MKRDTTENQPAFSGSISTQTGNEPRIIVTAPAQSASLADGELEGLAGKSTSPSRGISTTREPDSLRVNFDRSKPLTLPTVSSSISGNRRNISSEVPLTRHPVSNIEAVSSAESIFLGFLRKYGEAKAIRLADSLEFDISRFYPAT